MNVPADNLATLHARAAKAARQVRLALRRRDRKGAAGNWSGSASGSSIDFQDHRPYISGDDPRHIDWAAYARTGQYIMKLYREEVSPRIDVLFDASRSMKICPAKETRTLELLYFCVESALASGAAVACHALTGKTCKPLDIHELIAGKQAPGFDPAGDAGAPNIETAPLRAGSVRIFISDLLFNSPPEPTLKTLACGNGEAVLLIPFTEEESDPSWSGSVDLVECETGAGRRQRADAGLVNRYKDAYARHFSAWRDQAHRYGARAARVNSELELTEALRVEALQNGVVEIWT